MNKYLCMVLILTLSRFVLNDASVVWRHYSHHADLKTWEEARAKCKEELGRDLATIYVKSDEASLIPNKLDAWIGFAKYPHWRWCKPSGFKKWAKDEPDGGERCGLLSHNDKKIHGGKCDHKRFFICGDTSNNSYEFVYISLAMNWVEADQYCVDHHDDLAVFRSDADLNAALISEDYPSWIGLHKEAQEWVWRSGPYSYRNWAPDQPRTDGDCIAISSKTKKMSVQSCSKQLPYFCQKDNIILVNANKTWEEALDHCRAISDWPAYKFDLVSVAADDDFIWKVLEVSLTEQVWVGLRFMAGNWLWVDKTDRLPYKPPVCLKDNLQCGAISKNKTRGVEFRDCGERGSFICYGFQSSQ